MKIELSVAERRRLRRWVTHLMGRDSPAIEHETHALALLFENLLRDRLPELPTGPLETRHLAKIARIRLRMLGRRIT